MALAKVSILNRLSTAIMGVGSFIVVCVVVFVADHVFGLSLEQYGIYPRQSSGLLGILFSPFIHGDKTHLLMNMTSLLVLGTLVALHGRHVFIGTTISVALLGGAAVWCLGPQSLHIGASGIIYGYLGFLLVRGWYVRRIFPIALSILVAVYFGGALAGIFPSDPHISWLAHMCGFLSGILAAKWQGEEERGERE